MPEKTGEMKYPDGTLVGRYTVVPNNVLDVLAEIDLTKDERKILHRIIRNTIGYGEGRDFGGANIRRVSYDFPLDYLEEKTGVPKEKIEPILVSFEARNFIRREGISITFNIKLDEWSLTHKLI